MVAFNVLVYLLYGRLVVFIVVGVVSEYEVL